MLSAATSERVSSPLDSCTLLGDALLVFFTGAVSGISSALDVLVRTNSKWRLVFLARCKGAY